MKLLTQQEAGDQVGRGIESGIQFGGRFLLANIIFWVRGLFGFLALLFMVIVLVKLATHKKFKGLLISAAVMSLLWLISHLIFNAVNPL